MKNNLDIKELHIDKANYTPIATVKQEDNITMTLELYKEGLEFDITGQTVTLAAKRSDKVIIEQIDGFSIDTNSLTIELKNNINAKIGLVYLELNIKDETGSMTTLDFYLKVVGKILGEDSLDASDNIASLEKIQDEFIKSSNALLDTVIKNEDDRVDAEAIRRGDESTRSENEASRINAESERMQAENARVIAEQERASAEVVREEKINEFGSQVTKNTKNIADNSKDIERAFETINDNSFIPFEGENISVEHSKVGFTKDMFVEGRTYQNLLGSYVKTWTVDRWNNTLPLVSMLKPSTAYTLVLDISNNTINTAIQLNSDTAGTSTQFINALTINKGFNGRFIGKLTSKSDLTGCVSSIFTTHDPLTTTGSCNVKAMLLEGDYTQTNAYIPEYFEGIKSVGKKENKISILSCGKNLIDFNKYLETKNIKSKNNVYVPSIWGYIKPKHIKSNTQYSFTKIDFEKVSGNGNMFFRFKYTDGSFGEYLGTIGTNTSALGKTIDCIEIAYNESCYYNLGDIQLEEKTDSPIYEPYKKDKKEIVLPFTEGLKGLSNGVKDKIEQKQDGIYIIQNINKIIFNGDEDWIINLNTGDYISCYIDNKKMFLDYNNLTDKYVIKPWLEISERNQECAWFSGAVSCGFMILKSKLKTPDLIGFKQYLSQNPVTVYYKLAEPIEHKITDLNSINLETFKDITYVSSENEIQPKLSFKAPVDIPKTISTLKAANTMLIAQNVGLENKNKQLEKVNNKQTEALKDISSTTDFLIEDALTRKLNN